MIDYKALAERIELYASLGVEGCDRWRDDLRAVVTMLRGMAEARPVMEVTAVQGDLLAETWDENYSPRKGDRFYLHPAPQPQRELPPFPTMLRKMWSGSEVQAWLDEHATPQLEPTIDLDALSWASIKQAASESKWMPPEYTANDWVSDVCAFLREREGEPTEAQVEYEILCNDEWVAGASGEGAEAEILHYLTQYEEDGPCEVYAVTRRLVDRAALAAKEQPE